MTSLTVDDLHLELRRSSRRSSLQVTVDRGGELVVLAPANCDTSLVKKFVAANRLWIYRKLAETEALRQPLVTKEYVNGEGFPYLGRSYRILLVNEQPVPVRLEAGRFKMHRPMAADGRKHIVDWYMAHARPWLGARAAHLARRVGVNPSRVVVRDLGYRWGSCGRGETIYFHWKTILLPPRMVDYVIVHELVHLHEMHHTSAFWQRLERAMPDFAGRKQWLAQNAAAQTNI